MKLSNFNVVKAFRSLLTITLLLAGFSWTALAKENLTIVPTPRVCMVTNMVFPRDQIPVKHDGKTYYGCCENCKKTLSEDSASRTAIDPVTNKKIDKATAVIAAREDGTVIYFENKSSFDKYQKNSK